MPNTSTPADAYAPRLLGRSHAAALVAGSMLGVGIFLTPHLVASAVGTGWAFYGLWVVGALVAMAGALAVGELGTLLPHAGGDYVYLRAAYGERTAFLYGWLSLLASFSGAAAAMAVGIPRYQGVLLFGPQWNQTLLHWGTWALHTDQVVGIGLVWLLTGLGCLRVHVAGRLQLLVTSAVMAVLLGGAVWALGDARPAVHPPWIPSHVDGLSVAQSFVDVFFAYSGWNMAGYVASELRNPSRDLPWAVVLATAAIGLLYLLLCVAFVDVLGDLRHVDEAGSATAVALLGPVGGRVMAGVIAMAVMGALLATLVGGSRVYLAMARDGVFFRWAEHLHPSWGTPVRSLLLQAGWTSLLIASSTFESLVQWSSLAMIGLSVLTALAVPVLRRRHPRADRPFRSPGQPWLALVYVVPCALVMAAGAWVRPWQAVAAVAVVTAGWLAFGWLRRPG